MTKGKTTYEKNIEVSDKFENRWKTGKIVVKSEDRPWELSRIGRLKWYSHSSMEDAVLPYMSVFIHDVVKQGGKHKHQGGNVALYVLEGEGYSIVDGERSDWQAGDLILLPRKLGGVVHQHFNKHPGQSAMWLAISCANIKEMTTPLLEHIEDKVL